MCGIAGLISFKNDQSADRRIRAMTDGMAHRGPDSDGFFVEEGVALGHRRLSIIDLSSFANQPFTDNSGRYVMVYNGEIYNYESVKPLIPEYDFRTTSDTELAIAAYIKWGPECLKHFRGMFSLAIWDKTNRELFLARDRSGVKPLYYYLDQDHLVFASEQRAILASGLVAKTLDRNALLDYFSFQSVSFPHSALKNVRQLQAGAWMKIRNGQATTAVYWDVTKAAAAFDYTDKSAVLKRIRELMVQSIQRRLVSDVPVGAFLSGGIDSSAVVGLMAEVGSGRPNTFTISFEEKEYDESSYADMIAQKFNTNHTRISLRPEDFLSELQNGLDAMDTPSGDGINTYVVSKAIRKNGMTVALSGVGGDELFAGYNYFRQFLDIQKKQWIWKLPALARNTMTSVMGASRERISQLLQADSCDIENVYPVFRQILSPATLRRLVAPDIMAHPNSWTAGLTQNREQIHRLPLLSQFTVAEYLGYTQQTLLKDTDQMSMAVSLEVREPYFDQDLIEFMLGVPDSLKMGPHPKALLVDAIAPMLPWEIVDRPKQGFLFPWKLWLRNELRSFCETRIKNMTDRPFVNGKALEQYWQQFLKGDEKIRWTGIWLFVVLEYWLEKNGIE